MEEEIKLVSIVIYCPNLKKNVTINRENYSFTGWQWETDYAGNRGVDLNIWNCKCGKSHEVGI